MRLALLPGLLLALTIGAIASVNATAHAAAQPGISNHTAAFFSIVAQAAATSTTITSAATTTTGSATAATTITPTIAITGTGSVSPTATLAPLITGNPPGQGGGGSNLKLNPFDWAFLTSAPGGMGPFAWLGLLLMAGLFVVSAYFYLYRRPAWKKTNTMYYRAANRWGPVGLWLAILGLLLLLFRIIQLDFFNLRLWLYLWLLAAIAAGAYFFYWYRLQYPKEMARYQKTQRARQYMPGSTKTAARPTPRPSTSATRTTKTTTTKTTSAQRATSASTKKRKKR